jgi:DNA-binding transcriptional MerR regulator
VPYKEKEIEKLYYSIGEVAEMLKVNKSLLRFWETEFPSLRPKKASKGNRLYTKSDIDLLKKIQVLVKEKGFTIDGAKKQLKEKQDIIINNNIYVASDINKEEISDELLKIKSFLVSLSKKI